MAKQVCIDNVSVLKQCVDEPVDGPELVINGDFETPNGGEWILTGSASTTDPFSPNTLAFGHGVGTTTQNTIFENGTTYNISFDVVSTFNLGNDVGLYNGSGKDELIGTIPSDTPAQTYNFVFSATSETSDGALFIDKLQSAGDPVFSPYLVLDNISIKAYVDAPPAANSCRADITHWNPPNGAPVIYRWISKEFQTAKPINFGAYRCYWSGGIAIPGAEALQNYIDFNTQRLGYPLNPLNWAPLASSRAISGLNTTLSQNRLPLGGSPLYSIALYSLVDVWANIKIWGNETLRYNYTMQDTYPHRLPAGYRSERWMVEIEGIANVSNFKMAETGQELKKV